MIRAQHIVIAGFVISGAMSSGCGGSSTKPSLAENAATVAVVSPSDKLAKAVKIAELHLKYKEYDNAEKVLQAALSEPTVTGTAESLALLDSIKAAKRADAALATPIGSSNSSPQSIATQPIVPNDLTNGAGATAAPGETGDNPVASIDQPSVSSVSPVAKPSAPVERSAEVVVIEDKVVQIAPPSAKVAATDAMIAKLEARLQTENEAVESLKIYERFVERHTLTVEQEKIFAARVAKWKEIVGQKLVRWGNQWITPESALQRKTEADGLITQAEALMKNQDFKEVARLLEKASRIDANGISADFILGLLNSGVAANHPPTADEHFKKVLVRSPRHISALNNLALTEVKLGRFQQALTHFTQASKAAPRTPEINQNIGRLIKEATVKKLTVPPSLLPQFSKLYVELTNSGKAQPSNPSVGWLYMPLYLPENERQGRPAKGVSEDRDLVLCGSGSGFVVHPGYVLTNRHVVRDAEFGVAEGLTILDPADASRKRELPATVVAFSADSDIALVKCDLIKAPAIPLSISAPRRGTEILALGFPKSDLIGRGLKATRGIITALPEEENDGMLLFDAELNSGNSGGPVLDKTGSAVGVATAKFNAAIVGNYSAGIPSATAILFVKNHLPSFAGTPITDTEKEWPDIDARVAPSTVMLLCYYRSVSVELNQASTKGESKGSQSSFEDINCSVCNGAGVLGCPRKGCVKGIITTQRNFQVTKGVGEGKRNVNQTEWVKSKCPVCGGKGAVDCRAACDAGRDTSLGGR